MPRENRAHKTVAVSGNKQKNLKVFSPLAPSIPAAPVNQNQHPSLVTMMKEGFAFGAGSEMGHSLFRLFTGASTRSDVNKTDYSKCIDQGREPRLCKELYGDQDPV
jgi:hypothetical protein